MEHNRENLTGLPVKTAEERLKRDGFNELPSQRQRSFFAVALDILREPMLILLLSAGMVYLVLGEKTDALMLLAFVFVVIGITFYQERKTERALEALKKLSSPRALVIRDGRQIRIAGREVVVGDLMVLREGDRIPADARVLSETNLMVDESLLTGESLAVSKSAWNKDCQAGSKPGGEGLPFVFSGTLVTRGRGIAQATETGLNTEMGKIGKSLREIKEEDTLLKKETARLVALFAAIGAVLCVIIVVFYGLAKGNWLEGFLAGLTLSMSMLPEEFPVVLMVFLALGAWRISRRRVLTRNTAAIETLGAAKILCVDKTGTLTQNMMKLESLAVDGGYIDLRQYAGDDKVLPEDYHLLLEYSILASQTDPFDPIEKEIKRSGFAILEKTEHIHKEWKLVKEYPLSEKIMALSHVWRAPDDIHYVIAAKGAPEAIADLCHFNGHQKEKLRSQIGPMLDRGLRLIGVARASFKVSVLPKSQHDFKFDFVGLLGFADPVRPEVAEALRECYGAGVRVCMITGDYPGTAQFIAKSIGLKNPEHYLTGEDLQNLRKEELKEKIKTANIFARVVPEQKMLIIDALKDDSVIAMTGDGVNDAPAIKAAHIGIAMGERGTDVARETADLVLLKDDFSSIVEAVKMGRRIFDNLRKAIAYIFAVHIPIAGMALLPVVMGMPIILFPAHIAFLELIIDPACSVVFESEPAEKNIMARPPRNLKKPLFGRKSFAISLLQGLAVLVSVFGVFFFALRSGKSEEAARTLAFAAIVFANLMLIITNLSWSKNAFQILANKNKALYWVLGGALFFILLTIFTPFFRNLFHFGPVSPADLLVPLAAAVASILWFEIYKLIRPVA